MFNTTEPLLECVPNFSEGRNAATIEAIAASIRAVDGVKLLHVDISPAANRTVMTFAGQPEAVSGAAFGAIKTAVALIDMNRQVGVHPRIGAVDVCPLVPLANYALQDTVLLADTLGKRIGEELQIPVYCYEHSQPQAYRRSLPAIRKGQYEGLAAKMLLPYWQPDYGPSVLQNGAGATVLGVRDLLVAFNISLDTDDVAIGEKIAAKLRSRGSAGQPGLLPATRAIGWYMADYGQAQVSFNLLDYRITSPLTAFNACRELAEEYGVSLAGSEVIGLLPKACMAEAGGFSFLRKGLPVPEDELVLIAEGTDYMGLHQLKAFPLREKILEFALEDAGLTGG